MSDLKGADRREIDAVGEIDDVVVRYIKVVSKKDTISEGKWTTITAPKST